MLSRERRSVFGSIGAESTHARLLPRETLIEVLELRLQFVFINAHWYLSLVHCRGRSALVDWRGLVLLANALSSGLRPGRLGLALLGSKSRAG